MVVHPPLTGWHCLLDMTTSPHRAAGRTEARVSVAYCFNFLILHHLNQIEVPGRLQKPREGALESAAKHEKGAIQKVVMGPALPRLCKAIPLPQ